MEARSALRSKEGEMLSIPRAAVSGFAALVIGVPVGFAAAQVGPGNSDFGRAQAAKCPEAARAINAAGSQVDYFIPGCPTADELGEQLAPAPIDDAIVDACREALEVSAHPACAAVVETAEDEQR